jgi:hypothetical protein
MEKRKEDGMNITRMIGVGVRHGWCWWAAKAVRQFSTE